MPAPYPADGAMRAAAAAGRGRRAIRGRLDVRGRSLLVAHHADRSREADARTSGHVAADPSHAVAVAVDVAAASVVVRGTVGHAVDPVVVLRGSHDGAGTSGRLVPRDLQPARRLLEGS